MQTLTVDGVSRAVGQARRAARTAGVVGDVWRAGRGDVRGHRAPPATSAARAGRLRPRPLALLPRGVARPTRLRPGPACRSAVGHQDGDDAALRRLGHRPGRHPGRCPGVPRRPDAGRRVLPGSLPGHDHVGLDGVARDRAVRRPGAPGRDGHRRRPRRRVGALGSMAAGAAAGRPTGGDLRHRRPLPGRDVPAAPVAETSDPAPLRAAAVGDDTAGRARGRAQRVPPGLPRVLSQRAGPAGPRAGSRTPGDRACRRHLGRRASVRTGAGAVGTPVGLPGVGQLQRHRGDAADHPLRAGSIPRQRRLDDPGTGRRRPTAGTSGHTVHDDARHEPRQPPAAHHPLRAGRFGHPLRGPLPVRKPPAGGHGRGPDERPAAVHRAGRGRRGHPAPGAGERRRGNRRGAPLPGSPNRSGHVDAAAGIRVRGGPRPCVGRHQPPTPRRTWPDRA